MNPLKKTVSVSIETGLREKALKYMKMDQRSFSQIVNIALKEYLDRLERQYEQKG